MCFGFGFAYPNFKFKFQIQILNSDFKIKIGFLNSNFKKGFCLGESRAENGLGKARCGCGYGYGCRREKSAKARRVRAQKRARKSLGPEKPRRAMAEGLEHASHYVPIKLAILSVKLATNARELNAKGKRLRLPIGRL